MTLPSDCLGADVSSSRGRNHRSRQRHHGPHEKCQTGTATHPGGFLERCWGRCRYRCVAKWANVAWCEVKKTSNAWKKVTRNDRKELKTQLLILDVIDRVCCGLGDRKWKRRSTCLSCRSARSDDCSRRSRDSSPASRRSRSARTSTKIASSTTPSNSRGSRPRWTGINRRVVKDCQGGALLF